MLAVRSMSRPDELYRTWKAGQRPHLLLDPVLRRFCPTVLAVRTVRQTVSPFFKQCVFSSTNLFLPRKRNPGNERGARH
jgi:hypothetical protein